MILRTLMVLAYFAVVLCWMRIMYVIVMKMRSQLHDTKGVPMKFGYRDDSRDAKLLWSHHQVFPNSKLSMALIATLLSGLVIMLCTVTAAVKFSK